MEKNLGIAVRILLLLLMVATVSFTFYQSALPKSESAQTSESVKEEIIEPILPSTTPVGSYVQNNIRKIAHFVEFAALGAEVALYVALFMKRKIFIGASFFLGMLVALGDETIQIFSDRGSSVSDVWLDVAGFASAAIVVYLVSFMIFYYRKSKGRN